MLSILTQFLSDRSQHVMFFGFRSKLVNDASGVTQGNVLVLLLFILYSSKLSSIFENKLIGYADDSTLMTGVISPGVRVTAAECQIQIRAIGKDSEWCDLLGMKYNASKTKTMIVSRSFTIPINYW